MAAEDDDAQGWLSTIGGWLSGIPRTFQRPLLKAAGRLIYGLVNVPASALDAKADDIKHQAQMKRKVRAALVSKAIEQLPDRPELADRALDHFANDLLEKQQNREEVLRYAIEDLPQVSNENLSGQPNDDLDDHWLSSFSRFAENASSERLQMLFGKILSGEIQRSGTYSLFTIDFLSKLAQKDADSIVKIAPFVIGNRVVLTAHVKTLINFELSSKLGALNIVTATSIGISNARTTMRTKLNAIGNTTKAAAILPAERQVFIFLTDEEKEITFECILLTDIGTEVMKLHISDPDPLMLRELARDLKAQGAELHVGIIASHTEAGISWTNQQVIEPIEP